MKHTLSVLSSALVVVLAAGSAHAGTPADLVKAKQGAILEALKKSAAPQKDPKLEAMVDELFDYDSIDTASLADEWAKQSDADRRTYAGLEKQVVRRYYLSMIKPLEERNVDYKAEPPAANGRVKVKTHATAKGKSKGTPIDFELVMAPAGDAWKIVDIHVGADNTPSYVAETVGQYRKIIREGGFSALLQKLEAMVSKG